MTQAQLLGAQGVIGVRLTARDYDWGTNLVEFTAIGTVVQIAGCAPQAQPFASNLSGQEFWQLHQAGYWLCDIAFGVCSYYVYSDYSTRAILNNCWGSGWANREIVPFSQGFQIARHLTMERLTQDILRAQAQGVIGMHVDMEIEDIEYELNDVTYNDLLVKFIALGTAIVQELHPPTQAPTPLLIYDLKSNQSRTLS